MNIRHEIIPSNELPEYPYIHLYLAAGYPHTLFDILSSVLITENFVTYMKGDIFLLAHFTRSQNLRTLCACMCVHGT